MIPLFYHPQWEHFWCSDVVQERGRIIRVVIFIFNNFKNASYLLRFYNREPQYETM